MLVADLHGHARLDTTRRYSLASAADRMEDAEYVELRGTHFIQMEQPDRVHQLLIDFLARVGPGKVA